VTAPVTFLIPHLPGRTESLARMIDSVHAQTISGEALLVCAMAPNPELSRPGNTARSLNALLPSVKTEWLAPIADDDLLLPNYIEAALPHFDHADLIYSYDRDGRLPMVDCAQWPTTGSLFDRLRAGNFITYCFIRTLLVRQLRGWTEDLLPGMFEDWDLFIRLAGIAARFRCVPEATFIYSGSHHDN